MKPIKGIRFWLIVVIVGLILSGVTAFPLLHELNFLASLLVGAQSQWDPALHDGLTHWILKVREGLEQTYAQYPFIAYGTDWLAFGHLVIALFFIPPFKDPVRYRDNITMGMIACLGVLVLALVCGPIRQIPFYWRLIDCSFGLFAMIPLWRIRQLTKQLEESAK